MGRPRKFIPTAFTTEIRASSRVSVCINNTHFTFEYSETRAVPPGSDLEKEREALWDTTNDEVAKQITDTFEVNK